MFTGIIDHCGRIKKVVHGDKHIRITIACNYTDLVLGESIAVDGICLTVIESEQHSFAADISPETLRLTKAKFYEIGEAVNLERSLRLSDRLGGHFVMGHVDKLYRIKAIEHQADFTMLVFTGLEKNDLYYLIKKGSVNVNGVSLTINAVNSTGFTVMLIPHTLERTNLRHLQVGDPVNIEFDALTRIVTQQLECRYSHSLIQAKI